MIDLNQDIVSEIKCEIGVGYRPSVISFFSKRGYVVDNIDDRTILRIRDMAHYFWLNHTYEDLVQLAWVYAYCYVLEIPLILPTKREQYESLDASNS